MDSTRHLCSLTTFKWSVAEFSLEELVTRYRHLLPFPVLVTAVYCDGVDSHCTVRKGDVYWAHTALYNPWIVVKDKEGRQYKIPQCFDAMVLPIKLDGTEGIPFPFQDVREHGGYKNIRFVQPSQIVANDVTHNRRHLVVGDLEVVDVYDVTFIALHELHMEYLLDDLHPQQCKQKSQGSVASHTFKLLPSSAPVDVSLAVTLAKAPDEIYFHTMAEIKALVQSYRHNYTHHLQQSAVILVKNEEKRDDNYEYIDMSRRPSDDTSHLHQVSERHLAPMAHDIDPAERLRDLRRFYDSGEMNLTGECIYQRPDECADTRTTADPETADTSDQEGQSVSWLKTRFDEAARRREAPSGGLTANKPQERGFACQQNVKQLRSASFDEKPNRPRRKCQSHIPPINSQATEAMPEQHSELEAALQRRRILSEGNIGIAGNTWKAAIPGNTGNDPISGNTVPVDISSFSVEQVADYLRDLGLSAHVSSFVEGQVDGALLLSLGVEHLINDFRLSLSDATRLIHSTKRGSRP